MIERFRASEDKLKRIITAIYHVKYITFAERYQTTVELERARKLGGLKVVCCVNPHPRGKPGGVNHYRGD